MLLLASSGDSGENQDLRLVTSSASPPKDLNTTSANTLAFFPPREEYAPLLSRWGRESSSVLFACAAHGLTLRQWSGQRVRQDGDHAMLMAAPAASASVEPACWSCPLKWWERLSRDWRLDWRPWVLHIHDSAPSLTLSQQAPQRLKLTLYSYYALKRADQSCVSISSSQFVLSDGFIL